MGVVGVNEEESGAEVRWDEDLEPIDTESEVVLLGGEAVIEDVVEVVVVALVNWLAWAEGGEEGCV